MATKQEDLIAQLKAVTAQLKDAQALQVAGQALLVKIGTETDALQTTVQQLKDALANQPGPTQDLVDAINEVSAQAAAVKASAQAETDAAQVVDDKVPDAAPPATSAPSAGAHGSDGLD